MILVRYSSSLHGALFGFAQLFLDGLELLAQVVFALALVHVALDLGLDLVAQFQNVQLVVDHLGDQLQALGGILEFEHLLLLFGAGVDGRGDHVGQGARLLDGVGHLADLGRQARRQLHDARKLLDHVGHEGRGFVVLVLDIFEMRHLGLQIGLALHEGLESESGPGPGPASGRGCHRSWPF